MVEFSLDLMGGEVYIYFKPKNNVSIEKVNEIKFFIETQLKELVDKFNFFDSFSLLSKLNNNRNISYDVDIALMLEKSFDFYNLSNSKFNVFIGKEILDLKSNKKIDLNLVRNKFVGRKLNLFEIVNIDEDENIIELLNDNILIDFGGIAKGYIIDRILEIVIGKYKKEIVDLLIDARGDIVLYGKNKKLIEVENPFSEDIYFNSIEIKQGAVITSGHNKQKFNSGSHIIGGSCDILTISLKSEMKKCYELDALGTYLAQLNSQDVLELIEFDSYFKNIECLLILNNGKVLKSSFWI